MYRGGELLAAMVGEVGFSNQGVHLIMDKNKGSNIFKYLRDKYGEEVVRLLRNWENIIKKMADIRNHRHFMLRCIKVRITPVSCRLKKVPSI